MPDTTRTYSVTVAGPSTENEEETKHGVSHNEVLGMLRQLADGDCLTIECHVEVRGLLM